MHTQKKHMIDFIFPLVLFFVFALSALVVILLAANIYRSCAEDAAMDYTASTTLSYLSEKVHQGNEAGAVHTASIGGSDALVIEQNYDSDAYRTWIYFYDGALRELFVRADEEPGPSAGTAILELTDFRIEQISDRLLRFTCTDTRNETGSTTVEIICK